MAKRAIEVWCLRKQSHFYVPDLIALLQRRSLLLVCAGVVARSMLIVLVVALLPTVVPIRNSWQ